jgi:hypothetical protein
LGLGDETSGPAAAAVADAMKAAVVAAFDDGEIGSLDDAGLARSICVVTSSITKGIQYCVRWSTRNLSSALPGPAVRCGVVWCVGDQNRGMIRGRRRAKMAIELGVINGCPTILVAEAQNRSPSQADFGCRSADNGNLGRGRYGHSGTGVMGRRLEEKNCEGGALGREKGPRVR